MGQVRAPTVIALTPVRDEAWALPRFLASTALWADHIVIADQRSDDDSRAIAARHPKVTLVDNPGERYSEVERQRVLIDAARRFPAPRLLVALDADEILSANVLTSREWQAALLAPPGTAIELAKVELFGSVDHYIIQSAEHLGMTFPFAYVDDGRPHESSVLHACRVPQPRGERSRLRVKDVVVLHYQLLNTARQASKDRWYRCFERVHTPAKRVVEIERLYNWLARLDPARQLSPSRPEWTAAYRRAGIDVAGIDDPRAVFWWDWDILRLFARHGVAPFRHLDIWDFDWEALRRDGIARGLPDLPAQPIRAPRGAVDRAIRAALRRSHRLKPRRLWDPLLNLMTGSMKEARG
jgi:hypothetical protein